MARLPSSYRLNRVVKYRYVVFWLSQGRRGREMLFRRELAVKCPAEIPSKILIFPLETPSHPDSASVSH